MALRLLSNKTLRKHVLRVPFGTRGDCNDRNKELIGNREIVGYGYNGQPAYADRADFPFPSIRWQEVTPELCALREKEKGDWRKLSVEEKKCLYRSAFRQTFSEFKAPTGEWKSIVGYVLGFCSLGIWMYMFIEAFVHNPLPKTYKPKAQEAQLRRILDLRVDPMTGISSKWDYSKNEWK